MLVATIFLHGEGNSAVYLKMESAASREPPDYITSQETVRLIFATMKFSYHQKKSKFYTENNIVSYEGAGISESRRRRNNTNTRIQDCLIAVIWIGVVSYIMQYVITVRENGGGLIILRQRVFYTSNFIRFIARLPSQSPSHFAWWPSTRVSQTLRFFYLSHMIGTAKISRKIPAHLLPRL